MNVNILSFFLYSTDYRVIMENLSIIVSFELTLDPLSISPGAKYPIFLFGIFIYMFGAFCNLTLLLLIILTQSLHKPIYFILFSLPLNDFVGITSMLPKVLSDIVTETNNTYYPLCVLQGFLLHMYGVVFCSSWQPWLLIAILPFACLCDIMLSWHQSLWLELLRSYGALTFFSLFCCFLCREGIIDVDLTFWMCFVITLLLLSWPVVIL